MSEDLKDILSNLNPEVNQEALLLYLQGKLSPQQQHEVEKKMMADPFEADAMEGLEQVHDKNKLAVVLEQLKRDLAKKTEKKNKLRRKLEIKLDPYIIVMVLVVLSLIIVGYLLIHRSLNP